MKNLFAILLTLLLSCPVFAAGEIQFDDPALTGQTLYVVIKNASGNALTTGTTFATYTVTRGDFDQAVTEVGVTGLFAYTFPSVAAGQYKWTVYQDANDDATPSHTDDIAIASGSGYWTGGAGLFSTDLTDVELELTGDAEASIADAVADLLIPLIGSQNAVSPFLVSKDHSWRFAAPSQVTAPQLIAEVSGFNDLLLEMDWSGALSNNASINSISAVSVTDESGKTEPTIVSYAKSADQKKVHIITDGAAVTANSNGYVYNVTVITTDGQTKVRRGRLVVQ